MPKNTDITHWSLPQPPDRFVDNRFVNLLGDPDDYHVCLLASMGFTYNVISQQTGLSPAQIGYRLRRANQGKKEWDKISASNYRNGISEVSRTVIALSAKKVAQLINPELRKAVIDV